MLPRVTAVAADGLRALAWPDPESGHRGPIPDCLGTPHAHPETRPALRSLKCPLLRPVLHLGHRVNDLVVGYTAAVRRAGPGAGRPA